MCCQYFQITSCENTAILLKWICELLTGYWDPVAIQKVSIFIVKPDY